MIAIPDSRDRPPHCEVRGVVDVQLIDLANRSRAHADGNRPPPDDRNETFSLQGGQGLGIADARNPAAIGRHDHRRGDNCAARRCDTHLVDPGDARHTRVPKGPLARQGRFHRTSSWLTAGATAGDPTHGKRV